MKYIKYNSAKNDSEWLIVGADGCFRYSLDECVLFRFAGNLIHLSSLFLRGFPGDFSYGSIRFTAPKPRLGSDEFSDFERTSPVRWHAAGASPLIAALEMSLGQNSSAAPSAPLFPALSCAAALLLPEGWLIWRQAECGETIACRAGPEGEIASAVWRGIVSALGNAAASPP